jgi:hypothetical protein
VIAKITLAVNETAAPTAGIHFVSTRQQLILGFAQL